MNDWLVENNDFEEDLMNGLYTILNKNGIDKVIKLIDQKNKVIEELNKKINEYEEREEMQYLIKDEERFNYSMSDQVDY